MATGLVDDERVAVDRVDGAAGSEGDRMDDGWKDAERPSSWTEARVRGWSSEGY